MSAAIKKSIRVLENNRLEEGVYDLLLEAEDMAADAKPGSSYPCIAGMKAGCFQDR